MRRSLAGTTPALLALLALALGAGACGPTSAPRRIDTRDMLGVVDGGGRDLTVVTPCGVCQAPTALCDMKTKKCVACLSDNDCARDAICTMGTCMPGCSRLHSECGDAGSCDTDMGLCHGCLRDADCTDPKLPFCDLDSGKCAPCSPRDDRCPGGQYCARAGTGWACTPGCKADIECQVADGGGASSACCDHACVDTQSAARHCGGCGIDCKGNTCCGGACIDTRGDVRNCGACGAVCPARNAMPTCQGGLCGVGSCTMGFADCNGDPKDGCEIATSSDTNNCGACGRVCNLPNANALCLGGQCANGGCKQGFRDCDGNAANGCEVDVLRDARNCGACGQNCGALPHALAGCGNGSCVVASCDPGWGNCNGRDQDGCEAQLAGDVQNCGQCGRACPVPPNVVASCNGGACGVAGCVQGFGDCNNNPADGCEARFANDPRNCGACGQLCGAVPNGAAGCAGGVCSIGSCNAGFADCDRNIPNGCETNVTSDANNCGACGKVCAQGTSCIGGVCTTPYPAACSTDKDQSGSNYVICFMDKTGGWIAGNNNGGGCTYAALTICRKYGFTRVPRWGGTCGTICGYCGNFTCQSPQGRFALGAAYTTFDGGGGNPAGGANISCTVHWECAP